MARGIVERRLAACVSVVPQITSAYRWKGAIEESEEALMIIKTTSKAVGPAIETIREMHSYENPEILAIDISEGSEDYLKWVEDTTKG